MASSQYTYSELLDEIVDPIAFANIGSSITTRNHVNRAVRRVISELDLRSTKRKAQITPKIFDDIYDGTCPTDLKERAIIDVIPQANRSLRQRWTLVNEEYFDAKKSVSSNLITVADDDLVRKLRLSIDPDDTMLRVGTMDSLTADGGTWVLFGDATNVAQDTDNYIQGGGAVSFDLVGSGTTAGLQNAGLTTFDITKYVNNGSAFAWIYINQTTNLTNFIVRVGNDSSNYYTETKTTAHDGAAFVPGWNLLRFDFNNMTQTGTVTLASCDYIALYMTKSSGKSDDGYLIDDITLHVGQYYDLLYYSKYAWQNSSNAFIENSTANSDMISADTEELELFVYRGRYELLSALRMTEQAQQAKLDYEEAKVNYEYRYPSERFLVTSFY